ncbi:hypothetical protein ACOTET_26685 [Achromobacter xylosoxidans]
MELPRKVWILLPSFKPKEIEVETFNDSNIWGQWYLTANGKGYRAKDVYESKHDAIQGGLQRLEERQQYLDKQLEKQSKRRDALMKATVER